MTQGKSFFNSKQTDGLRAEWLAGTWMFPESVYYLSGVVLPEVFVTHKEEQTSGHKLWLLIFRSLCGLIMKLPGKKILINHHRQLIVCMLSRFSCVRLLQPYGQ